MDGWITLSKKNLVPSGFKKDCAYDIVHFVLFDLTSKVNIDLDPTLGVLFFDNVRGPFCRAAVTNDPKKYSYARYGSLNVSE